MKPEAQQGWRAKRRPYVILRFKCNACGARWEGEAANVAFASRKEAYERERTNLQQELAYGAARAGWNVSFPLVPSASDATAFDGLCPTHAAAVSR